MRWILILLLQTLTVIRQVIYQIIIGLHGPDKMRALMVTWMGTHSRFVIIAMEAMDQLLLACHSQTLNLFVESFLKMVQKLLESTDPQLQILATQSVRSLHRTYYLLFCNLSIILLYEVKFNHIFIELGRSFAIILTCIFLTVAKS